MLDMDKNLNVMFKTIPLANEAESVKQGRPIFTEMEVCQIFFAGDRNSAPVFPAHDVTMQIADFDGSTHPITYAERFKEQYARFKAGKQQVKDGTPLDELPFLTVSKRSELKGLSIYTAEQLSDLDGAALKSLGMDGRRWKDEATAYLKNASGSADVTRFAAENLALKDQLAALQAERDQLANAVKGKSEPSEFDAFEVDDIKAWIKEATGNAPRGNPSKETLVRMAEEIKGENS